MKVKTADQENPDGSLNIVIEDLSQAEQNVLLQAGLISLLTDEANRVLQEGEASQKYMISCTELCIHPVGEFPKVHDGDHTVVSLNTMNKRPVIILNRRSKIFDPELVKLLDKATDRLMDQKAVQDTKTPADDFEKGTLDDAWDE